MTIVERDLSYPSFIWAKDIKVVIGAEDLEVTGATPTWPEDVGTAPDVLRSYRRDVSRFRDGRLIKVRPWQFANADCRKGQIEFVRRFGPVVVSTSRAEDWEGPPTGPFNIPSFGTVIHARQNLAELESEQRLYRSAFVLLSELRKGKEANLHTIRETVSVITDRVTAWPAQWERESRLRVKEGYLAKPDWTFGPENVESLQTFEGHAFREPSGN